VRILEPEIQFEYTKAFKRVRPNTSCCERDDRSVKCRQDWPSADVERRRWRRRTRRDFFPFVSRHIKILFLSVLRTSHEIASSNRASSVSFRGNHFSHGSGLAQKPCITYLLRISLACRVCCSISPGAFHRVIDQRKWSSPTTEPLILPYMYTYTVQ
jgi:hypothetical protein